MSGLMTPSLRLSSRIVRGTPPKYANASSCSLHQISVDDFQTVLRNAWRLFPSVITNSRHAFRKTVWKSSTEIWCKLHEEAFAYFGGVPRTIRLDNLKEGVIKPDIYDPQLNWLYAKMLEHNGIVALPCRPYAPDLKGKVESAGGNAYSRYHQAASARDV